MGGTQWQEVLNAQTFLGTSEKVYMRWLNVAPSDADHVYVLASIRYYDQGILLQSADGGDTWARSNSVVDGRGVCLAVDPTDSQRLYLGSWYRGVYRSGDGGATWESINDGLPTAWAVYRSIAVDPSDAQHVYLSVGGAVYHSVDGGDGWSQLGDAVTTGGEVDRVVVDPTDSNIVYALVYGEGVYKWAGGVPHLVVPQSVSAWVEPSEPDRTVRRVSVQNGGGGTLDWQVSDPTRPWLSAQKVGADELELVFDKSGLVLVDGRFSESDTLTLTDDAADNSPQEIRVTFYVGPISRAHLPVVLKDVSQ